MKLTHVGGLLAARPGGRDPFQVGRQPVGVTDQGDALSAPGEAAGLFHGQERLTATGAAADLDTVEQPNGVENDGLMLGECVSGVLVGHRPGNDITLR